MKLRLKVLVILGVMWAFISAIIYFYSLSTLSHDYAKLERNQVIENIERTHKTFENTLSALRLLTLDWAQWDDSYRFMTDKNSSFIKSNLAFTTFKNAKINLILFFDTTGNLFYGANYDLVQNKFIPVPEDLIGYLKSEKKFTRPTSIKDSAMGIWRAKDGYVVLTSQPILTSEGNGPIHGALIMGYFLNDAHIQELSEIVKVKVTLYPLPLSPQNPHRLDDVLKSLTQGAPYYIAPRDEKIIYGYTLIKNVEQKPIGILGIEVPRDLYNEGIKTLNNYLIIVISTGILFLIAIWYLLKIFILDRIISVSQQVVEINSDSNFANRIKISGEDELSSMVAAINSLMEIIELAEEQLKHRIFLRTEELERLSNLNKNLYVEMNRHREVEIKLREGEKILKQMAYYDALTGLPNRTFFNELLQKTLEKADQDQTQLAILFFDVDKFKNINDTYGHDIGDKFLQHIAIQLKHAIKDTDITARLAGDEFIVCLTNNPTKAFIEHMIQVLLMHIEKPLEINGTTISSTFSIGISIYPADGKTAEELQKNADLAMYYAKKRSGSTYCYYDEIKHHNPIAP